MAGAGQRERAGSQRLDRLGLLEEQLMRLLLRPRLRLRLLLRLLLWLQGVAKRHHQGVSHLSVSCR